MEKWEYKTLWRYFKEWEEGRVEAELNQLGQQGWEVAGMAAFETGNIMIALKRRKP